jgi:hypothetical protein
MISKFVEYDPDIHVDWDMFHPITLKPYPWARETEVTLASPKFSHPKVLARLPEGALICAHQRKGSGRYQYTFRVFWRREDDADTYGTKTRPSEAVDTKSMVGDGKWLHPIQFGMTILRGL